MKLERRTILITGGTSGIGLELARQLQRRGNTLLVTGRDQEKLDAAQRILPGLHTFKSDVSNLQDIGALYRSVSARFPALDTLINNAGIMRNLNLNQDRDLSDVTREIEINLSGPVRMIQQFLRVQLEGTAVTVIELAPPGVETPLFRGEFAEETCGQKPMSVDVLAARAIAGIEAGKLEIRPGLSNVLELMSRIAPEFMLKQMAKIARPKK